MIYVFNKNKIFSYVVASTIVLMLFAFQDSIIPKDDIELIKISTNIINNETTNKVEE